MSSSSFRPQSLSVEHDDGPSRGNIDRSLHSFAILPKREHLEQNDNDDFVDASDNSGNAAPDDDTGMEAETTNAEVTDRSISLEFDEYSLDILKHMMEKEVTQIVSML